MTESDQKKKRGFFFVFSFGLRNKTTYKKNNIRLLLSYPNFKLHFGKHYYYYNIHLK